MQLHRFSVLSVLLCSPVVLAQEPFAKPAEQLQKFAPIVGTWEGSGTVSHGPSGPEEPWTSKSSARWVLGGHCLREDVRIEMESMNQPLEMCNLYGWDRENRRYVSIGVSNLGEVGFQEVHWTPDGKMVTASKSVMMGMPIVDRWVTEFAGDGHVRITGHQAQGDGPFYEHVTGEMKRTSKTAGDVDIVDAAFVPEMVAVVKEKLGDLKPILGEYRLTGWWLPAPGAEKVDFTGNESIHAIFDGTVFEMISKGDPMEDMPGYEGLGWMSWDDHAKCYKVAYANNMGEISEMECRLVDDKLIGTSAVLYQGQPTCMRGVTEIGEQGFTEHAGHMMTGAMPPVQVFEATYERK